MNSKIFRIFVSSTFDDMLEERRILGEKVFPEIRKLCRQHDADLQVIDLRWGVSPEAILAQRTQQICLREIERCQKLSMKPSFIALVGQRYGFCPLPDSIHSRDFQSIHDVFPNDNRLNTLNEWYRIDKNSVPPRFLLRERSDAFLDDNIWNLAVVEPIQSILRESIVILKWNEEERVSYTGSLTHQEIFQGILKTISTDPTNSFSYIRTITDLTDDHAKKYKNLTNLGKTDTFAEHQINELRNRLSGFKDLHHRKYSVQITSHEEYSQYLDRLSRDVCNDLMQAIESQFTKLKLSQFPIMEEAFHENRLHVLSNKFVGREKLIQKLLITLTDFNTLGLCLTGCKGSGKSSILAQMGDILSQKPESPIVIIRFIGLTPGTSTISGILKSIIIELTRKEGLQRTKKLPNKVEDLWIEMANVFMKVNSDHEVYIILDDADTLDFQFDLVNSALESKTNIKYCLSFTETEDNSIHKISFESNERVSYEAVPKLDLIDGMLLLQNRLSDSQRIITEEQLGQIINEFSVKCSPQWLVMASHYAVTLRSFDSLTPIGVSLEEISLKVLSLLTTAESHGKILVSRFLSYLVCSRFGLTENEVITLLENDSIVMETIKSSVKHPLEVVNGKQKIPTSIWSRLLFDLEPFFSTSQSFTYPVLKLDKGFSDSVFSESLMPIEEKETFHLYMANYFQNWETQTFDEGLVSYERAATELIFHELKAKQWKNVCHLLTFPEYIAIKTRYYGIAGMLEDYQLALSSENFEDHSIGELEKCKKFIIDLAGSGARTIEEHEQLGAQWSHHTSSVRSALILKESKKLERIAKLLTESLKDYAELYVLWESIYIAQDRNATDTNNYFFHDCSNRHKFIPIPALGIYIKKYPVTEEEFGKCCDYYISPWKNFGDRIPATGINWREAFYYSAIHGGRLPTLTEWIFAAGGNQQRIFPWGNVPTDNACNSSEAGIGHPTPVDQFDEFGKSPLGVCDMIGNTWEFIATAFPTLKDGLLEVEYAKLEQPIIIGGSFETPLRSRNRAPMLVNLLKMIYADLGKKNNSYGLHLFENGLGVSMLDMCLFDTGNSKIGFRYVVDFTNDDYYKQSQQVFQACKAFNINQDYQILTSDGVLCAYCNKSVHPNDSITVATSITSPAVICQKCLKSVLPSIRQMAKQCGDGKLYYGHSLMPTVALNRNLVFQRMPNVQILQNDKSDDIVFEIFKLAKS